MPVISHGGIDYTIPTVDIQDDASATDFEVGKVPTGPTIKNYINNRFLTTLYIGCPTAANTWQTVTLTGGKISDYVMIMVTLIQYGNTLTNVIDETSWFKQHSGTGNRVIAVWAGATNVQSQVYYVDDTHVGLMQSTVSGGTYRTIIYGIMKKT